MHELGPFEALPDNERWACELRASFVLFARVFYQAKTGREFIISNPQGREPHVITIARELKDVFEGKTIRLNINVPPGHHKSTLLCLWVAWCYANYPDSNFLYISLAYELAEKHTAFIKEVMELPRYKELFNVHLRSDSKSKGKFKTTAGGTCAAFGSKGAVVGNDAGLPNLNRFSGAVIMDDMHAPADCFSDTIRQGVIDNYKSTISQRPRSFNVPIIFIGQRLHEDDLPAFFIDGREGYDWKKVILTSFDEHDNPLYPEVFSAEMLRIKRDTDPYNFASQHMQNPQPPGGGIFQKDWFYLTEIEPPILCTFLTIDTAETDKTWNDATAMSFWGVYKMETRGITVEMYGLHWLDAREIRVEPKDLEAEFYDFYSQCMRHRCKPDKVLIEKKSTGSTLLSTLKGIPGLRAIPIERNAGGGNKTARFYECQQYIASKRVSLTKSARHVELCLEHMRKITGNMSHAHDDLCFIAGTKIATLYGDKNIQDIRIGDYVITPFGIDRVKTAGMTNLNAQVISNIGLIGTSGHPIFTNHGFKPLDSMSMADRISSLSLMGLLKWRIQQLSYSMAFPIDSWDREDIILVRAQAMKDEKGLKGSMSLFGNFITNKLYKKAMWFITKMATLSIMTFLIWSVYRISNIWKNIGSQKLPMESHKNAKIIWQEPKSLQRFGIAVKRVASGIERMLQQAYINLKNIFALGVEKIIYAPHQPEHIFAASHAEISKSEINSRSYSLYANHVDSNFQQRKTHIKIDNPSIAPENVPEKQPVYNLTIENHGVYYANGILVSNCDTLEMAIRGVFIDETLLPAKPRSHDVLAKMAGQVSKLGQLRQAAL